MDLSQIKLNKTEWENIEIPVSSDEKRILEVIVKGSLNTDYYENDMLSIISYLKIVGSEDMEGYLYVTYFNDIINKQIKQYNLSYSNNHKINTKRIKTADKIRVTNLDKSLTERKEDIFEYIVLEIIGNMLKDRKDRESNYYTLKHLIKLKVYNINKYVNNYINFIVENIGKVIKFENIIKDSSNIIERNKYIYKYRDIKLYDHQKKLFMLMNRNKDIGKLILYSAPTGTGKTLSPIGLSEDYKVIFVCAARHVGLALAKSCISVGKKVAFAFGCETPGDIRLHYYAAKDYTRNKRTGVIRKVDNSVGDKVEIMITDIKSYICAMHYMKAFNSIDDMVMYWDEPTIGLDYEEHDLHAHINKIWVENEIKNIVLSSATLPNKDEIKDTLNDYRAKFKDSEVYSIRSIDCKKSITLMDSENNVVIPHTLFKEYDELMSCVNNCMQNKTILRYMNLDSISKFITKIQDKIEEYLKISNYFEKIEDITMDNIKVYYLTLLSKMTREVWEKLEFSKDIYINSTIHITTKDSHTLTAGPTIYIADDIDKIGKFCIQTAKIPEKVVQDLMESITYNNKLAEKIAILDKKFEDMTKKEEEPVVLGARRREKEKKVSDERFSPEAKRILLELEGLRNSVKSIELHDMFVPNKPSHLEKWAVENKVKDAFSCDIENKIVERIMLLEEVDDNMKLLLLMGIGVLKAHNSIPYTEIMKELAISQKLFIIIASSDYIYGTNYQFCHSYIGKDLDGLTQEKIIQALGRVGRGKFQQDYTVRFRNNNLIKKLYLLDDNKPEVRNMNRLFNTDI